MGRPRSRRRGPHRGDPRGRGRSAIRLLVDSGPLYAYLDADDAHHDACVELLEGHDGPLILPSLCLAEVAHLLTRGRPGGTEAEVRLLGDLAAGELLLEPVDPSDLLRIAELVATYAVVCRNVEEHGHEDSGHEDSGHEHSGHEHADHEHAGHEHSIQVAELDTMALDILGPLAIEADVPPSDLLDELVSRC